MMVTEFESPAKFDEMFNTRPSLAAVIAARFALSPWVNAHITALHPPPLKPVISAYP